MGFVDTGLNIPENPKTLLAQQAQLLAGKRHVQMFPAGLNELPLPDGFCRHQNQRGVFVYTLRHIFFGFIEVIFIALFR